MSESAGRGGAANFNGLRVVSFESRLAAETAAMIERYGGRATVAPSMREAPLEDNQAAFEFADRILAGGFDIVILLTGVGVRQLFRVMEMRHLRAAIVAALSPVVTVARGPKPVAALRELGLEPTITIPEPNTWRELLASLGPQGNLTGKRVAVQEYGISNRNLIAGLEARGAQVMTVPVYRWTLPVDRGPLRAAVRTIADGEADAVIFTSASQVSNVIQIAEAEGIGAEFRRGLGAVALGSIGPVCSQELRGHGVTIDFEPEHPKLGHLIREAAARSASILAEKRGGAGSGSAGRAGASAAARPADAGAGRAAGAGEGARTGSGASAVRPAASAAGRTADVVASPETRAAALAAARVSGEVLSGAAAGAAAPDSTQPRAGGGLQPPPSRAGGLRKHPMLAACRREAAPYTPIWLMRQAGRYMPEYRRVREQHSFLDMCMRPEVAAEVTVTAVERLRVDAAIIFADILLPLVPMRVGLHYEKGDGPMLERPLRSAADLEKIPPVVPVESLGFVGDAIRLVRKALGERMPIIGFAGAPFTLASYLIEGGGSRQYQATKTLMYTQPETWHRMMEMLARVTADYLKLQVEAGADLVQIFDSWVGSLGPDDYRRFVLPHTRSVIETVRHAVPVIHFGTVTGNLLELMREAGGDVIGLDWRVDLAEAWERLGPGVAVQGNLDPIALFADIPEIRHRVRAILEKAGGRPGHIFNLGHGILPETPVDHVIALVDMVHEMSQR